jgi:LPXTG-motif cell wall-anchored protein
VIVVPTGPSPTASPTASPSASTTAAPATTEPSDGSGGGLPVTGSRTTAVAGLGALLPAAGAAGFLVARRRRTRFIA